MTNETDMMKAMFGPVPEGFSQAVQRGLAAPTPRQRFPARAVFFAAALLLLSASAYAAAARLGLWDVLMKAHPELPAAVQEAIVTQAPQEATLGPLTITLLESLSDPYLTYAACTIDRTGSDCLLVPYSDIYRYEAGDKTYVVPHEDIPECERLRLGLPEGTSYLEAAELTGLPIYAVHATLQDDSGNFSYSALPDLAWNESGQALLTVRCVDRQARSEDSPLTLTFSLHPVTAPSSTVSAMLHRSEPLTFFPVLTGVTATCTYMPIGSAAIGESEVLSVLAEQTACGIYFTITSRTSAAEKPTASQLHACMLTLVDSNHRRLPTGASLARNITTSDWPLIYSWHPTALKDFPEQIIVTDYLKSSNAYIHMQKTSAP